MFSLFDTSTGIIEGTTNSPRDNAGYGVVQGSYAAGVYYVKNGIRPLPPKPGSGVWDWDLATESWIFNPGATSYQARQTRNKLLSAVDRVNPIWYASLGVERQVALQEYRQALLAVPQQPGFPERVTWPTMPPWF